MTAKTCIQCGAAVTVKIGRYWLCPTHEREFRRWERENMGFCREVYNEFKLVVEAGDAIRDLRARG